MRLKGKENTKSTWQSACRFQQTTDRKHTVETVQRLLSNTTRHSRTRRPRGCSAANQTQEAVEEKRERTTSTRPPVAEKQQKIEPKRDVRRFRSAAEEHQKRRPSERTKAWP